MKIDTGGYCSTVQKAGEAARAADAAGYDGWWVSETVIDPFLACAVASQNTRRISVGTSIAVAFARNPMTVAIQANDVQALSGGRFLLGLGSQIETHITKRYSMRWSRPAARMREFVLAVRAIWSAWEAGAELSFEGDFYTHTFMPPFFNPGPNPHGNPKIMLGGVGPLMTEAAGEVADGFLCHPFSTERYLREVTLPALERGRRKLAKTMDGFEISGPSMILARDSEEEIMRETPFVKQQIAFYGSTPAYKPVLELHGWGELHHELQAMTFRGDWEKLHEAIDDEVLRTFAIIGAPDVVFAEIKRRYGDVVTRMTIAAPE
jgi:probable F420-dependent oxidoreductase